MQQTMSETRKIKVKSVQAADPKLIIVLDTEDGGNFAPFVQVTAAISNTADGGNYNGQGVTSAGPSATEITVTADFTDDKYSSETSLNYTLSILFSNDGRNYTPFSGSVGGATGTVPVTHDQGDVVLEEAVATAPPAGSNDPSKNKGCLAFLTMLPF